MRKVLGDQAFPTSCRHFIDQRPIVITGACLVEAPRHRPRAKGDRHARTWLEIRAIEKRWSKV
jgi:hypothetical protein